MPNFITPDQAAAYLGMSAFTLSSYRHLGKGPAFYKVGKHVKYRKSDLETWIDSCRVSTSEVAA
ncbi:MAG: excisionase family DNA binding protein [Parasphingorhabdus sp.]|jgi:excisionase family DNA binding protein|uniref:helix-turn-helix domain-containing protein n=1 Tax=Parasphingorhabdus sp. TaxID=2709688 RepID=UPI0039E52EF6